MSKLLYATLFSLLLFVGLHVSVDAKGGSAEEKDRSVSCTCLVKEPNSSEESDSNIDSDEECEAFVTRPPRSTTESPTTSGPQTSTTVPPTSTTVPPTTSESSSVASSSSSAAPSSSSDSPSTSSAAPTSSVAPSNCTGGGKSCECPPGRTPGHFKSRSRLMHAMKNYSASLTITERCAFEELIKEVDEEDLSPCGCPEEETEEERSRKVVKVAHKLKKHLSKNKSLKKKTHYKKCGNWGHWRDFIVVANDQQQNKTVEILELDGNDECELFEALRNETAGNATESAAVEELIIIIRKDLKQPGWSKTQKQGKCHRRMRKFAKKHPEMEEKIDKVKIGGPRGKGNVESHRSVFKVRHQATRLHKVIGGNTTENCELLKKLNETASNTSIEITKRVQIMQLKEVIQGICLNDSVTNKSMVAKLQCVSEEIHQCLLQSPWVIQELMDIELEDDDDEETCACKDGKWGDVYELKHVSHFCSMDSSCHEVEDGEGKDCDERKNVIKHNGAAPEQVPSSSWWVESIQKSLNSGKWSSIDKVSFSSDFNRMKMVINKTDAAYTEDQRILDLVNITNNYQFGKMRNEKLKAIPLQGGHFSGDIDDFCKCSPENWGVPASKLG